MELLNRTGRDTRAEIVLLAEERLRRRLAHRMTGLVRSISFLWITGMGLVLTVLFAFFHR